MPRKHPRFISLTAILAVSLICTGTGTLAHAEDFKDALVSAYLKNPRLMAERARVREADENYVQARAQGRVTVNANGQLGRSLIETESTSFFGGVTETDSWTSPRSAQLSIVKPLYQGGRVKSLKAQAKSGILAARQGLRNAEQNILLAAATAYLDVLRDEEAARIRRNNVRVLTQQGYAAQDRFDVGEGTKTDIAQAESRLAASEIGLAQAEAQLAVSRAAYVRYMGHMPEELSPPPKFELPRTLFEAQQIARINNPQMIAARYNENAAQAAVAAAKSAGRPTLSLQGTLQGARDSGTVDRSKSAAVVAQIRVPLYQGGINASRVRAAKEATRRARYEIRDIEYAIDQAVANLWAQVTAAELSLVASRKQVSSAEVAFEGVKLEQEVGTRNTLDVLNAEQELLNAKLSVVEAERAHNIAIYQMLVTMGGFDAYALQLPVDYYDPQDNFDKVTDHPLNYFVPDSIEKPAENIIADVKSEVGRRAKQFGTDTADMLDILTPDQVAGPAVYIAKQVPDVPKSAIEALTVDDAFDDEAKTPDPEKIDPMPDPFQPIEIE